MPETPLNSDRSRLTDNERDLIRAAEMTPWNEGLREALAHAVHRRGGHVKQYHDCGELADFLEMLAGSEAR